MLVSIDKAQKEEQFNKIWLVGLLAAVALGGLFVGVFVKGKSLFTGPVRELSEQSNTQQIGELLYQNYMFAFEIASLLLLVAIIGAVVISLIIVYLHYTDFGAHEPHNGFLRFSLRGPIGANHPIPEILRTYCGNFTLISVQDTGLGGPAEYAYQLYLRSTAQNEELVAELEKVDGIENINLTMQEKLLEV